MPKLVEVIKVIYLIMKDWKINFIFVTGVVLSNASLDLALHDTYYKLFLINCADSPLIFDIWFLSSLPIQARFMFLDNLPASKVKFSNSCDSSTTKEDNPVSENLSILLLWKHF